MSSELLEEFARMALDLHGGGTVPETVETVLEYAVKAVNAQDAAVVFVHKNDQIEVVAATGDGRITEIESLQVVQGEGPTIDVPTDRFSVLVTDTRTEQRWPRWAAALADRDVRSLLSVRLYTSAASLGFLHLYDEAPDAFDVFDQEVAHVLARHAAVALSNVREVENLWRAIDGRKRIGQAQGILMARFGLTEDQAFNALMRVSNSTNTKLREVAEMVVATGRLPEVRRP